MTQKVIGDLITIYQWAGMNEAAKKYLSAIDTGAAPGYVLQAMARVARDTGDKPLAIDLYAKIIDRFPEKLVGYIGMAWTYADTKSWSLALDTLMMAKDAGWDDPEYLGVLAHVYDSMGDTLQAFWTYNHLVSVKPEQGFARRKRILLLSSLGASGLARELAAVEPDVLSQTDLDRIKSDRAALQVRYGQIIPENDAVRFDDTDIAIKMLEDNMETFKGKDGRFYRDHYLRARFDRLIALRDRSRMTAVITEFEKMQREGLRFPVYIWIMAGDAYLYLEEPEKALDCYRNAEKLDPESFNIRLSIAYTLMELDEFDGARLILDQLSKEEPAYRVNRKGKKPVYGRNNRKLRADFAIGLERAFSDNLQGAQERFEDMTGKAPYNEDLRQALAYVYLWRGWPRLAFDEFEKTLGVKPDLMDARLGRAFALIDLRRYAESEKPVLELKERYPENKRVQKVFRAFKAVDDNRLTISTEWGNGGQFEPTSESLVTRSRFTFSPINFNTRFFIQQYYANAEILGEWASYQREGVGVEFEGENVSMTGEVFHEHSDLAEYGFEGAVSVSPNDYLSAGISYDSFSHNVPLRASLEGIGGWETGLHLSWRHSELLKADMAGDHLGFSDGNQRNSGSMAITWSPIYTSHFKVPVSVDMYASTNSERDRPYFNPSRDFVISVSAALRWLVYRRYTKSFQHNLEINYGSYKQEGFDAGRIGSVSYEHTWNFSDSFNLTYKMARLWRLYDGVYEISTYLSGQISWRF